MKAIRYSAYGTSDELTLEDVALPDPARGQVRVRVRAASYNPMDGKIRRGEMKIVTGRLTTQNIAGVANAAERGILVPEIGSVVPLSDGIAAIAARESARSGKGKLVIVPV